MKEIRNAQGRVVFACTAADIDMMGAGSDEYDQLDEEKYCQVCGFELNIVQKVFGCPFQNEPDHVGARVQGGR